MSKRMGLGLVLVVLMALVGGLAFAAPEPQSSNNDRPGTAKQGATLQFEVFDTQSLLAEWTVDCGNGSTTTCSGSMEYCLGYCHAFCGRPCTCPTCDQVPQQE